MCQTLFIIVVALSRRLIISPKGPFMTLSRFLECVEEHLHVDHVGCQSHLIEVYSAVEISIEGQRTTTKQSYNSCTFCPHILITAAISDST